MTDLVGDLRELVWQEQARFGVPGLAVAVVREGEVVLAEGFGLRDAEASLPVTPATLFPISSNTKAFTAATLCVLAEEGRLDLDAPLRTLIPWFAMSDPHATALATTRDLLAHRTGLPRHDMVWVGDPGLDLEGITRCLPHLESSQPFRHGWIYSNLLYQVAGYVTEVASGKGWRDTVSDRLLAPLGMTATGFSAPAAAAAGDFAFPYRRVEGSLVRHSLPVDIGLGPPGGMVSNAEDLGQWLLARLGHEVGGTRVLSDTVLAELHTPAIAPPPAAVPFPERLRMGYALGNNVEAYRGHRLVHHGGSDPGYTSAVFVAPDAAVGVAVLCNLDLTNLPEALALDVLDRLLDLPPTGWGARYHDVLATLERDMAAAAERRAELSPRRPATLAPEECAGTYAHPAYGTIVVSEAGGVLDVDYHGFGDRVTISHRDRDTWDVTFLDGPVTLALQFLTGMDGEVTAVAVAAEAQVEPIRFTRLPDPVDPALLEAIAGRYVSGPLTAEVTVTAGHATLSIMGTRLPLEPHAGTTFTSPSMPMLRVRCVLDEDTGRVERLDLDPWGVYTRDHADG